MTTITEARDDILTLFAAAWPSNIPLYYWDVPHAQPTADEWARISVRHTGGQNGALGNRQFDRSGIVTVQLFTIFGRGLARNDVLTKVVMDAFEGASTPNGVWFRNVRPNEIGQDGKWFNTNVSAQFEYCEVK